MRSAWQGVNGGFGTRGENGPTIDSTHNPIPMKPILTLPITLAALLGSTFAGTTTDSIPAGDSCSHSFANARRPISNPTLFDLALPTTNLHPIFLNHRLPGTISPGLPVGGDVQLYALQFEIALNERFSIVATKDGYVDVDPDATLSGSDGFANLGAGFKYAFLLDPESGTAASFTATLELPTGNSDVFQGEGDGLLNVMVTGLKLHEEWQFAGALGLQTPLSNQQAMNAWLSAHASYEVCDLFIPLVELNWFHVLDPGNGAGNFPNQVGGAVPAVIPFEGGDLFNLGAANAGSNRDFVTAAFGFRSRLSEQVDLGVAYEIPLTNDRDSLMKDRLTLDLVWQF